MCLGHLIFNLAFTRRPIEKKISKGGYIGTTLMGDRLSEFTENVVKHRELLKNLPHEELFIKTDDGLRLKGWFFDAGSKNTAIIVHGFNSKGWTDGVIQAYRFFEHGYNVLLSDNRACGESEGKYLTFGIRESEDTKIWTDLISKRIEGGNIVLLGISLGGATVCMCSALDIPGLKAVIADCPYTNMQCEFEYVNKLFLHHVPKRGIASAEKLAKKRLGFDFTSASPLTSIAKAKCPVLFVHGKSDSFIPYSMSEELYNACPTEKQLLLIDDCGHGSAVLAGEEYFEHIFAFVDRYCNKRQ